MSGPEGWRAAVVADPALPSSVKVFLLALATKMRRDGRVSVPRAEMARRLGRSERRITERVGVAVRAGYLAVASPGYRGHTAVYVATLPTVGKGDGNRPAIGRERGTPTSPLSEPERGTETVPPVFMTKWTQTQPQERSESEELHPNGTRPVVAVERPAR